MKKIYILIPLIIAIIIASNVYYYLNIYHLQVDFQKNFLLKQTQISGYEIEKTGQDFLSDLNFILFSENINKFFTDPIAKEEVSRKIEIFYTKYQNLITGINLYDTHRNSFTFYKDNTNKRISNIFVTREQKALVSKEEIRYENGHYAYYLPVFYNNQVNGNIVVMLDYQKYIGSVFEKSHLGNIQWQWLLNEKGKILFSNLHTDSLRIMELDKIAKNIKNGYQGTLQHKVIISGHETSIISAYYPAHFLGRDFGIVFSLQNDVILKTIIKNAIIIATLTLVLIILIIILFVLFISRQKTEERKLKNSEQNLQKILENIPIGILILDKDRRILFLNNRARETFSETVEELKEGQVIGNWFFEGTRNQIKESLGLGIDMRDFLVLRKDTSEWVLLKEEIPIVFHNKEATLQALIDVTPLEKARRQEAAAVKAKTEMLVNMSQEIRIPLGNILDKTSSLLHSHNKPDESFLKDIKYSADLLISIVDDILEFSKIEAGKMMLEEIPFKLRSEIKIVFNEFKPKAEEKGIKLITIFDENVHNNFIGDPFNIRQILSRLVENAINYTDKGIVKILVSQTPEVYGKLYLHFEISDTGCGLSPEQLDKFNQKDIHSTNIAANGKKHWTGLGIPITIQLIDMLNGDISFVSPSSLSKEIGEDKATGPGTTVQVKIPVFSNERFQKDIDISNITRYSQIRALIIKNNDDNDNAIQEQLKQFGVNAIMNFYMDKTVHLLESNSSNPEQRYHLLIIKDSPTFDGFELLYTLNERKLTNKYIIILTSSNDKKGNYTRARKLGADYYLIEPVQGSEIFNIIQDNFTSIELEKTSGMNLEEISRSLKILVAEDNTINQKVLQVYFKNLGIEIDIADDGSSAVEKAKKQKYDLILMDVMMPIMDGWEATRTLRKLGIETPIIAVTADVSEETKIRSIETGMNDFIPKPVKIDDIKRILVKWFSINN
ncbi:MAG TPA: PAS domain-containing sensor histidine kinase [Bacteroidetes bacterium]|nr:PAS domain-containing sensor histidine kinase [Bacteroidota bacterium]